MRTTDLSQNPELAKPQSSALNFVEAAPSNAVIDKAIKWLKAGDRIALLTLVVVDGSSPYPLGTQMIVAESGQVHGQVTGGCAEADLIAHALQSIKNHTQKVERYGHGSPYIDIQLPCGSAIEILIDGTIKLQTLLDIQNALRARRTCQLITDTQTLEHEVNTSERKSLPEQYVCQYTPRIQIVAAGQGPVLFALAQQAKATGFDIALICQDQRTQNQLSQAGLVFEAPSDHSAKTLENADLRTAFVSLFHEHHFELPYLSAALKSPSFYIGALGSRHTHQNRVEALEKMGVEESSLERIHGPIGLNLPALSPEQIAISIMAEIVQCQPI